MGVLPEDPVEAAIRAIAAFHNTFKTMCPNTSGEGIARRLKEFPQLMLQVGLVPALTFYASKLDEDKKRKAYEASVNAVQGQGDTGGICSDASGEGGGYPQALALLIAYAAERAGCSPEKIKSIGGSLVECLGDIAKQGIFLEKLVESYAEELKKLATALYEEKPEKKAQEGREKA